jgi:hypothetical protein
MAEVARDFVADTIRDLVAEIQDSEDSRARHRLTYRKGAAGELYIGIAGPFPVPEDADLTTIERDQLTDSAGALVVYWDNGVVEVTLYDADGWRQVSAWL